MWNNAADDFAGIYKDAGSSYMTDSVLVQGLTAGPGVWNVNPQLIDPDNGDYRPSPCSPVLNKGLATVVFPYGNNSIDINGNTRLQGSAIDLGPAEYDPSFVPSALTLAMASQQDIRCTGEADGSVTLSAAGGNGGWRYAIGSGALQTSPTFSNLSAGTYTFIVEDNCGTTQTRQVTFTNPAHALLALSNGSQNATCGTCNDGIAVVQMTGGIGTFTYSWADFTTVNNDSVRDVAPGTYQVTVTDGIGCSKQLSVQVGQTSVSRAVPGLDLGLKVYPNPGTGVYTIRLNTAYTLEVTNVVGTTLLREARPAGNSTLDLSHLPQGVYTLRVATADGQQTKLVVKQ